MSDQTNDLLRQARAVGALILPDAKRRPYESARAQWRTHCRVRGLRVIVVHPAGPRRSVLSVEAQDGATELPDAWCNYMLERWRAHQRCGLSAVVEARLCRVRLPHDEAVDLAHMLAVPDQYPGPPGGERPEQAQVSESGKTDTASRDSVVPLGRSTRRFHGWLRGSGRRAHATYRVPDHAGGWRLVPGCRYAEDPRAMAPAPNAPRCPMCRKDSCPPPGQGRAA
jgi:hypothetical protein